MKAKTHLAHPKVDRQLNRRKEAIMDEYNIYVGTSNEFDEMISTSSGRTSVGVAVLDSTGTICYLNAEWKRIVGMRDADAFRVGNNYLAVLRALFEPGNTHLQIIANGLRLVLSGEYDYLEVEYPYARAGQWRFFLLRIIGHPVRGTHGVILQQFDITNALRERMLGA
jgi:PAS domain-containing protein